MGRAILHAAAWTLATGAAVTLSWFGVHTVLAGTEYDPPRTLPLSGQTTPLEPGASSTRRPPPPSPSSPSSTPSGSRPAKPSKSESPAGGHDRPDPPRESQQPSTPGYEGNVRGINVPGGRGVFDMREDHATLVSATPDDGWETQVWKDSTWIRVTFSREGASSTVFCRWDDGPPRIESYSN